MKALIIGGNRYFGKRLASRLIERGDEVTLLNRGLLPDGFGSRVRRIKLDRRELRQDHPALGKDSWDVVFDQACYEAPEARSACQAFANRTGRLIFTSSLSIYQPGPDLMETDFDPRTYRFAKSVGRDEDYGEAKRQAEAVFFRDASFAVTAVRFPIVLGEDDYTGRLQFHVDHAIAEQPIYFPNSQARLSFIHAEDAAATLEYLSDHLVPGPLNASAELPIAIHELMRLIEEKTGHSPKVVSTPGGADPSPFGVETDWFMDTLKLRNAGFKARPVMDWLPALIDSLTGGF